MKKPTKTLRLIRLPHEAAHEPASALLPSPPRLPAAPAAPAARNEPMLIRYLRSGVPYIISPGAVRDVYDGSGPIGTGTILTDGEWAWPDTLSHYVEKYHLELPQEFVSHATSAGFTIPDVTVDDLRRLQLPT